MAEEQVAEAREIGVSENVVILDASRIGRPSESRQAVQMRHPRELLPVRTSTD